MEREENKRYNDDYIDTDDKTFTFGTVYNSKQSTGFFNIGFRDNLYDSYQWSPFFKLVSVLDNKHRVTGLKDLVTSKTQSLFTTNWDILSGYYDTNGQGYIDKEVNFNVLDYNKNLYEMNDLKDNYQKVRLTFFGNNDERFRLQLMDQNYTESIR